MYKIDIKIKIQTSCVSRSFEGVFFEWKKIYWTRRYHSMTDLSKTQKCDELQQPYYHFFQTVLQKLALKILSKGEKKLPLSSTVWTILV